ncbi:MAG: acyl-CoA thioesterase [Deltaproteobacteria bacterium]
MDSEIEKLREGFPVWVALPVQWGDQDAFGHVNNTAYFRWFESARIAYGGRIELSESGDGKKIAPILAAISCNYRRQLKYPDTVHVGARIIRVGRSSLTMEHRIVSAFWRVVAAEGDSTLVAFDYAAQKSVPVPAAVRTRIEQLEGKTFPAIS